MTATILSAMPMRDLTKLAYSQHRDAEAAYNEIDRRAKAAGGYGKLSEGRTVLVNAHMDCGDI